MKKLLKVVNSLLFVFFICFTVYMLVSSYDTMSLSKLLTVLCIIPLIMLVYLLDKLKIYHMDEVLIFFYYLFILLALVIGSVMGLYYKIWWFDLLVHFVSGFMTSIVAFVILQENKIIKKKNKWFCIAFIIIFSVFIGACWEYFEFFCDKLFKADAQWVKKTGMNDTMTDMLIATLASILSALYFIYYFHKKKIN